MTKKRKWVMRGKRNREAGERFEMKILRSMKTFTLDACRSAGSHGLFDLWVLQGNKLRLIIAKTNGYLDKRERRDLARFMEAKPAWAQVEVHFYKSPKKVGKTIVRDEDDIKPYYGPRESPSKQVIEGSGVLL